MKWLFWTAIALIAYTYLGYPCWLWLRKSWRYRPIKCADILPSVSIVMAVHNEAVNLPEKLRNLRNLEYPADRVEIVVVSDGSNDGTNAILLEAAGGNLQSVISATQAGKAAALNAAMQRCAGEILLFSDARQLLEPAALRHLVANFADASVGCVSGELMLGNSADPMVSGVGLYWKLEKAIRRLESVTGSVVGATGAIYAVRRSLAVPFPAGTLLDDVLLPLQISRQGYRTVFEPKSRAWDRAAESGVAEFRRKVRTLTGNYQLIQLAPWLLTPRNPLWLEFISHKFMRLAAPFLLLACLVTPVLVPEPAYRAVLLVQLSLYGLAVLALLGPKVRWLTRAGEPLLTFVMLNAAAVVAFMNFVRGKTAVWVR